MDNLVVAGNAFTSTSTLATLWRRGRPALNASVTPEHVQPDDLGRTAPVGDLDRDERHQLRR